MPTLPDERLQRVEQRLDTAEASLHHIPSLWIWIEAQHNEIERLREQLREIERVKRITVRTVKIAGWVIRIVWNTPMRYLIAIAAFIAWATGKMTFEQLMMMVGGRGGGEH